MLGLVGFQSSLQLLPSLRKRNDCSLGQGGAITGFQLNLCLLPLAKLKVRAPGGAEKEGCKVAVERSKMKWAIYRTEIMRL